LVEQEGRTVCAYFGPSYDAHPDARGTIFRYLATVPSVRSLTYGQVADAMLASVQLFCPEFYRPLVADSIELKVKGFEALWGGTPDQTQIPGR